MDVYQHTLLLLEQAAALMESIDDSLIAAHIATPIALVEERVGEQRTGTG